MYSRVYDHQRALREFRDVPRVVEQVIVRHDLDASVQQNIFAGPEFH
jgi:hypothetical protein